MTACTTCATPVLSDLALFSDQGAHCQTCFDEDLVTRELARGMKSAAGGIWLTAFVAMVAFDPFLLVTGYGLLSARRAWRLHQDADVSRLPDARAWLAASLVGGALLLYNAATTLVHWRQVLGG